MSMRHVGLEIGRAPIAVIKMELEEDWVHLRAPLQGDRQYACRMLNALHLQYHVLDVPHRVALDRDVRDGIEFIDALSVPRQLAEEYLFPKLVGLADQADSGGTVH